MNQGGFDIMAFLPLIMIFIIFYFLLIRPQQKKMKQQQAMLAAIRRGDKVMTAGGLIGTVAKVTSETELLVEVAENVKVRVARAMISDVLTKTEAVNSDEQTSSVKSENRKALVKRASKSKTAAKKD